MVAEVEKLGELYGAWWIDFLGEHCHVGGEEVTQWLLDRSAPPPGPILDAGAFVGATARLLSRHGARVFATDANPEFLAYGRGMPAGSEIVWVAAPNQRLPFPDLSFAAIWCLDAGAVPQEFSRIAAARAELLLCTETPEDGRGGAEAFVEEWAEFGWRVKAHRSVSGEALQIWQRAEAQMVGRRSYYEPRYGKRSYLAQLDQVADLVRAYSMHELGHGLFVFERG